MTRELLTTQGTVPPGVINFGLGHPGSDLLPLSLLAKVANHRLNQEDPEFLQYGHEYGGDYFRQALSLFLSEKYGREVPLDDLMATNGASQALDMICHCYTQRGDVVFVEEPSYFLGLDILRDHGLTIVPIAIDDDGLVIEALEAALAIHRPRLLYTIPIFHNPAAVTLSEARRKRLVELSVEHDFLLVCDEVYQLLNFNDAPVPPPMRAFDPGDRVLSMGSFSKIMAPGLRLGWIEADPAHLLRLSNIGIILSGGGLNPFTAELMRSAIEMGLQAENLTYLKNVYANRINALDQALQRELPEVRYRCPEGGFFFWLEFPKGFDTIAFNDFASQTEQVFIKPGPAFSSQGAMQNYARLCFAFHQADELADGVARMAKAYRSWTTTSV